MKRLKLNLSVFALILGVGSAVAFTPAHNRALHKWGRLADGSYTNIDTKPQDQTIPYDSGSYHCNQSNAVCTTMAETQPATGSTPAQYVQGTFVAVP